MIFRCFVVRYHINVFKIPTTKYYSDFYCVFYANAKRGNINIPTTEAFKHTVINGGETIRFRDTTVLSLPFYCKHGRFAQGVMIKQVFQWRDESTQSRTQGLVTSWVSARVILKSLRTPSLTFMTTAGSVITTIFVLLLIQSNFNATFDQD